MQDATSKHVIQNSITNRAFLTSHRFIFLIKPFDFNFSAIPLEKFRKINVAPEKAEKMKKLGKEIEKRGKLAKTEKMEKKEKNGKKRKKWKKMGKKEKNGK